MARSPFPYLCLAHGNKSMADPSDKKPDDDPIGRKLATFAPGPVLVIFSQFIAPFEQNWFVPHEYQAKAGGAGAAIGLVLSVALRPILMNRGNSTKQVSIVISLAITIALLLYCYYIWTTLGPLDPDKVQALQNKQTLCFILAMSFLCLTINVASLAYARSNSSTAIIIVIVAIAILVLVIIAVYFYWQRLQLGQ